MRQHETSRLDATPKMRCIRGTNALEGQHMHTRQAQHPGAKASGLVLANARSCLFDFAWDMKALARAGLIPDLGHFWPWLNDLCVRALAGLPEHERAEATPPVLRNWRLTDTSHEPLTRRGVQWDEVYTAAGDDQIARPPSALRARADIDAVLATTELTRAVVRGDAAAVGRLSRVVTDPAALNELKERTIEKALAWHALKERGVDTLRAKLRTTAPEAPSEPTQPAPLAARVTADATGPLPALAPHALGDGALGARDVEPMLDVPDARAAGGGGRGANAGGAGGGVGAAGDDDAPMAPADGNDGASEPPRKRAANASDEALANRARSDADAGARMAARRVAEKAAREAKAASKRAARAGAQAATAPADADEAENSDEMEEK